MAVCICGLGEELGGGRAKRSVSSQGAGNIDIFIMDF